jgi:hypothetical protein
MPNLLARQASRFEENLYRLFVADSPRAYRIALACLLPLVLAAMVLLLVTGAVHQRLYPCDHAILLDAGWRLFNGQRPHVDFFFTTGGGVAYYLLPLLGLLVGGPTASALAYGPALLLPILALWAWWLARRRLPAMAALGFAAMVGGLVAGVFPLGCQGWCGFSYAMQYNRFGWSLLCVLALTMLVGPRQAQGRRTEGLEGVSSGLLLGLLVLFKIAYGGAGVIIVVLGAWLHRRRGWFWLGIAAAFLAIAAAYAFYMRGNVLAYWRDTRTVFSVVHSENIPFRIARVAWASLMELWPLGAIVLLGLRPVFAAGQSPAAAACWLKAVAAAAVCAGLGIVATAGNYQGRDVPLFAVACVVVMVVFQRLHGAATSASASGPNAPAEAARLRLTLGWLAAGLAAASFVLPDFGSIANSAALKFWRGPRMGTDWQVDSPAMKGLFFPKQDDDPDEWADAVAQFRLRVQKHMATPLPRGYALWINDGLRLLHGRTDQRSRVFALAICNPFPFALQLPPPTAVPVSLAWRVNMDETHYPAAERLFSDVTHLMVSKPHAVKEEPLWRIYGAYIDAHFVLAGESDLWRLYTRK